jgi:Phage integrase, N-terminal SAM-like domain
LFDALHSCDSRGESGKGTFEGAVRVARRCRERIKNFLVGSGPIFGLGRETAVGRNGFAEDAGSEVDWIGECILSEGGQGCPSELQRKETTMSPLRARMIEDMTLAGLAEGTQRVYVQAVRGVTAHYRRSPDLLSEEEVRGYLLGLRQRGVARGTFQTSRYGLRFFYHHTLDRAWALFGGKKDRLATTEAAA